MEKEKLISGKFFIFFRVLGVIDGEESHKVGLIFGTWDPLFRIPHHQLPLLPEKNKKKLRVRITQKRQKFFKSSLEVEKYQSVIYPLGNFKQDSPI